MLPLLHRERAGVRGDFSLRENVRQNKWD